MVAPAAPPPLADLLAATPGERLAALVRAGVAGQPAGRYLHWDQLQRMPAPAGFTHADWWLAMQLARQCARQPLGPPGDPGSQWRVVLTPGTVGWLMRIQDALGLGCPLQERLARDARRLARLRLQGTNAEAAGSAALSAAGGAVAGVTAALTYVSGWADRPITTERVGRLLTRMLPGAPHHPVDEARLSWVCRFADAPGADPAEPGVPMHGLLRAAVVPAVCLTLRPLAAGNGRLGRLLGRWCLLRAGYATADCLAPSAALAQTPTRYERALQYVRTDDGDLTYLVDLYLRALWQSLRKLERTLDDDEAMVQQARARLADAVVRFGLNDRQLRLVLHALEHPGSRYEIADHQRRHGTTYQTARTDLLGLAEFGLLEQSKRGRAFVFVSPGDLTERLRPDREA